MTEFSIRKAMKLVNLKIQNFRSFGKRSANKKMRFRDGINLIVGENNVGKSNILSALEVFKGSYALNINDWNSGDQRKEIALELEVDLSDKEWKTFTTAFVEAHSFWEVYGQRIRFTFSSKSGLDVMQKLVSGKETSTHKFRKDMQEFVCGLLARKLKNFSEVRQRPGGSLSDVSESLDGRLLADALMHLKMGNPRERKKFELVKKKFTELFPTLRFEVAQERPNVIPRIVVEKIPTNYEVPVDRVGAGIGEIVILLTHLVATEEGVFGLDMPELHLHPHSQRLLLEFLKEHSKNNQILIVTHSPLFLDPTYTDNMMLVREFKGETIVTQLPEKYLDKEEKIRLQRHLDIFNREFVFSRASLIVEGPTELGAMPIFSKALKKDFYKYGVSLIRTGKHFGLFVKLLEGLFFPYFVMSDRDALMHIEGSIKVKRRKVKTSPVFYNLSKIDLLVQKDKKKISSFESEITRFDNKEKYPDELFNELSALARKYDIYVLPSDFEGVIRRSGYGNLLKKAETVSDSKVMCCRLVAEKILQDNLEVPKEFADIINAVTEKSVIPSAR